jgi:hypothetical protein
VSRCLSAPAQAVTVTIGNVASVYGALQAQVQQTLYCDGDFISIIVDHMHIYIYIYIYIYIRRRLDTKYPELTAPTNEAVGFFPM